MRPRRLRSRCVAVARPRCARGGNARFIRATRAGAQHSCRVVTVTGGGTRCWGANGSGQLGNGTTGESLVPSSVVSAVDFTQLGAGTAHSCALTGAATLCVGATMRWADRGWWKPGRQRPDGGRVAGDVQPIVVGGDFACGLGTDALTYCWGNISGARWATAR
jgi:hypothetical protein